MRVPAALVLLLPHPRTEAATSKRRRCSYDVSPGDAQADAVLPERADRGHASAAVVKALIEAGADVMPVAGTSNQTQTEARLRVTRHQPDRPTGTKQKYTAHTAPPWPRALA